MEKIKCSKCDEEISITDEEFKKMDAEAKKKFVCKECDSGIIKYPGLDIKEIDNFLDVITKADDTQLDAMANAIKGQKDHRKSLVAFKKSKPKA